MRGQRGQRPARRLEPGCSGCSRPRLREGRGAEEPAPRPKRSPPEKVTFAPFSRG